MALIWPFYCFNMAKKLPFCRRQQYAKRLIHRNINTVLIWPYMAAEYGLHLSLIWPFTSPEFALHLSQVVTYGINDPRIHDCRTQFVEVIVRITISQKLH